MMPPQPARDEFFMNYYDVKKAFLVLRALNNNVRQLILKVIYENKQITVTDICVKASMEQAVASQHLAILRRAGVVSTKREGKRIYYSINFSRINQIAILVNDLSRNKTDSLGMDDSEK